MPLYVWICVYVLLCTMAGNVGRYINGLKIIAEGGTG